MRTLDGSGKVWTIWNPPGRFTKNPDMVRFPDGRLMLVFCETDQHWALEFSKITTLESSDGGKTWGNPRIIASADITKGEERWVTPRLSRLKSGRLVIVCDHDDYHYYHVDRPSGIWMWTSDDNGRTWSAPHNTGVKGIEPGRVIELPDGTLLITPTWFSATTSNSPNSACGRPMADAPGRTSPSSPRTRLTTTSKATSSP